MLVIRCTNSLLSGRPGTITKLPPRSDLAASSTSSRRSASRFAASGPWQRKQLSERIGRMSRLKSIAGGAAQRRRGQQQQPHGPHAHSHANRSRDVRMGLEISVRPHHENTSPASPIVGSAAASIAGPVRGNARRSTCSAAAIAHRASAKAEPSRRDGPCPRLRRQSRPIRLLAVPIALELARPFFGAAFPRDAARATDRDHFTRRRGRRCRRLVRREKRPPARAAPTSPVRERPSCRRVPFRSSGCSPG